MPFLDDLTQKYVHEFIYLICKVDMKNVVPNGKNLRIL